ncbi:unnamed protein product [Tilletia controversa]|nr:unnamed protein product [Tilletia controversa]
MLLFLAWIGHFAAAVDLSARVVSIVKDGLTQLDAAVHSENAGTTQGTTWVHTALEEVTNDFIMSIPAIQQSDKVDVSKLVESLRKGQNSLSSACLKIIVLSKPFQKIGIARGIEARMSRLLAAQTDMFNLLYKRTNANTVKTFQATYADAVEKVIVAYSKLLPVL